MRKNLMIGMLLLGLCTPVWAGVEWNGNVMTCIQQIGDEATSTTVGEDAEFNPIWLNLNGKIAVCDGVSGTAQIRARVGAAASTSAGAAANEFWARCLFLTMSKLVPKSTLDIGRIDLNLGRERDFASVGAWMMKNKLINNSQMSDSFSLVTNLDCGVMLKSNLSGGIETKVAITNGNAGNAQDNNSAKAITLGLSGNVPGVEGLSAKAGYYTNDATVDNGTNDKTSKMIIDLAYAMKSLNTVLSYGQMDVDTGTKVKTTSLNIEASYDLTPACWGVVRYSYIEPDAGADKDKKTTKTQIGLGYKLYENTQAKLEYMIQEKDDDKDDSSDKSGIIAGIGVAF